MLRDDHLDAEESAELLATLRTFAGERPGQGEFMPPTDLPLDSPPPPIVFEAHSFMCTGTFAFGTREECKQEITDRGGAVREVRAPGSGLPGPGELRHAKLDP